LGCTIIQLVDGKAPYEDLPPISAIFKIGNDEHPPYPSNISQASIVLSGDFLSKCLNRAPDGRSSARELANHQWIRWCQDMMKMDGDYESNVKYISDWHVALAKSSPRDALRHGSQGMAARQTSSTPLGTGSTYYAPYMAESAAQRTVSSIAKYEENSDDDWDNAFENLDDLQFKRRPKIPAYIADSTAANPIAAAEIVRQHALSFTSDMQGEEAMPPVAERSVTHPRTGQQTGSHVPARAHTSPPSPNMRKRRTQTHSQDAIEVPGTPEEDEDEEHVPVEGEYGGAAAGRRNSTSTTQRAAKRPSLGLVQRRMSTVDTGRRGVGEGTRGRTYSSLSLETADLSGDQSAS
ncbi:Protein kinase of the Mitotic Exit Network, partial [Linderina pennispora]